ncbi:hypothetical protein T440DRAFT_522839 [Plenodomus tracheiphilus IPT5]|uniref:Uncharacterized protein n=1 Tax=Plenodomus tracheiphilus IPT5 TaxID=1408161 RepID=A0A6A7ASZ7_9PLEO|nr:hypothetical protein T440DRAFT_522839 [Plenodomus tracheiphilus IPT5]
MQNSNNQVLALTRGDLRKQLSAVLAGIKTQGLKVQDVMAEEMQDHLPGLAELAQARTYISELEGREQILQTQNDDLLTKLKFKEAEIANQPADFKSLEIELQQAQRHTQMYKGLADDTIRRADRLQHRLDAFVSKEAIANSVSTKVETLQARLDEQLLDYQKLLHNHNAAAEVAENQREQYQHAFNAQRERLQSIINEKTEQLSVATAEITRIEAESQGLQDAYTSLIDTLEVDHANVSAAVNEKALQLRKTDITYKSIQAEIEPLKEFSVHATETLQVYRTFAHALLNPATSTGPVNLSHDFNTLMDHMADDLKLYEEATKELVSGRAPHALIREYLDTIYTNNARLWEAFDSIQNDVINYIRHLGPKVPTPRSRGRTHS